MAKPFQRIMHYIGEHGIVRPRDIEAIGLPREYLLRLCRQGKLVRSGRGIYTLPEAPITDATLTLKWPSGYGSCLLFYFRHLPSTKLQRRVPPLFGSLCVRDRESQLSTPPSLRIVRLSRQVADRGNRKSQCGRMPIRVYSAAKTVADCFKFRNKIGLDVAIEALKDTVRQKKATINEIYRYAKICRVSNVIRPYMEAL